jgi:hypothetical protein
MVPQKKTPSNTYRSYSDQVIWFDFVLHSSIYVPLMPSVRMVLLAEVSKAFWSWQELIFGSEVSSMAQVDFCGCVTFVFFPPTFLSAGVCLECDGIS